MNRAHIFRKERSSHCKVALGRQPKGKRKERTTCKRKVEKPDGK